MRSGPAIVASVSSALLLAAAIAGSGSGPTELPARLSATGLYDSSGEIDPHNLPYSPQYPLWTDGAEKSRWIFLPQGSRIDATDIDAWSFPVGTKLWKEFAWSGRKVETRLLWLRSAGEWVYASYAWDESQADALLVPEEGLARAFEIASGKWHSIPSRMDCVVCHEGGSSEVLGFNALQLSDDRDPLAPHAEALPRRAVTLGGLVQAGLLDPARSDLVERPPRIRSADPVSRAVLGYLGSNCGSCHNGNGELARLGLDFQHGVDAPAPEPEAGELGAIDVPGHWIVPGVPEGDSRIVAPGAPALSSLFYRMASRSPSSQMPPIGTVLVDDEALQLVGEWVASLGGRESR